MSSINIHNFPMGPALRSYLGIQNVDYQGESNSRITEAEKASFRDVFLETLKQKPLGNDVEFTSVIDELVAMDFPLLVLATHEAYPDLLDQNDFQAQFAMGIASMLAGELEGANGYFARSQQLNPQEPAPYVNQALILSMLKDYDSAIMWADAGLKIEKNNFKLWQVLGQVLFDFDQVHYMEHLRERAARFDSWAGKSLVLAQNPSLSSEDRIRAYEAIYDEGERDPAFLVEYSAILGQSNLYDRIPAIVWEAGQHHTTLPWQLHMHCAQAHMGMEKFDLAREQIGLIQAQKDHLPESAIKELVKLQEELTKSQN